MYLVQVTFARIYLLQQPPHLQRHTGQAHSIDCQQGYAATAFASPVHHTPIYSPAALQTEFLEGSLLNSSCIVLRICKFSRNTSADRHCSCMCLSPAFVIASQAFEAGAKWSYVKVLADMLTC